MSLAGPTACVLVGLWLLLTLLYQYIPFQTVVAQADKWQLLPSWAFFAPRPAYRDVFLLVRQLREDGSASPFSLVAGPAERVWLHALWNPAKRPQRVVQDAGQAIRRLRRWAGNETVVMTSLPYLMLLHHVTMHGPFGEGVRALQFLLVETSGREEKRLWISFISGFHRRSQQLDKRDFSSP